MGSVERQSTSFFILLDLRNIICQSTYFALSCKYFLNIYTFDATVPSLYFADIILPEDLKPMYKPPPKIPCEPAGTGLNKKVYFVTHERKCRHEIFFCLIVCGLL